MEVTEENKQYFADILTKNEEILGLYKPNKAKYFFNKIWSFLFGWIMVFIFYVIFFFSSKSGENPTPENTLFIVLYTLLGVFVVALVLTILLSRVTYKNRYYAYTNKRVIIRSGLVGVDFKSLDLDKIGALNVRVDLVDKMLKKNTGTIRFGSMASPINQQNTPYYSFTDIEKPYEIYKIIKEDIDDN
jgi:ABC-type multidrug transport system fused ATPase/permease subunit